MKLYKSILIDYQATGSFHEMFNLSLLLMCSCIFEKVEIRTGHSAYKNQINLCQNLGIEYPSNVVSKLKRVINRDGSSAALLRTIIAELHWLKDYITLSNDECLITNYSNPFALPVLLIANQYLKKKVVIAFHGELELLENAPSSILKPSYWYAKIFKFCFEHLTERSYVKLMVLGDGIRQNILSHYPRISENVIAINHPYLFPNSIVRPTSPEKLTLGVLGRLDNTRGLDILIRLSEDLKEHIEKGRLQLKSIGPRPIGLDCNKYTTIEWGSTEGLSRVEFAQRVQSVDYITMLYPVDSYRFTASGVAMDALCYLKPIIGLRNSFVNAMVEKDSIGMLADDYDGLVRIIKSELEKKSDQNAFVTELKKTRQRYSIEYNAKILENVLIHY